MNLPVEWAHVVGAVAVLYLEAAAYLVWASWPSVRDEGVTWRGRIAWLGTVLAYGALWPVTVPIWLSVRSRWLRRRRAKW